MSDVRHQTDVGMEDVMDLLMIDFEDGDPSTLHIAGELDLAVADRLRESLEDALARDPRVVVDMGGVTFIDASGLRVVLDVAGKLNGDGPLSLVNAERVEWLLELVGLRELPSLRVA